MKATITVGYLLTPPLQSRYDCKNICTVFLLTTSLSMAMMGLSFTSPAMSGLTIPCLVVAGLSFGLGQGPPLSLVQILQILCSHWLSHLYIKTLHCHCYIGGMGRVRYTSHYSKKTNRLLYFFGLDFFVSGLEWLTVVQEEEK